MPIEQTKSITVRLPEGYSATVDYYDVTAIRSALQRIETLVGSCISKDDQEAQQGADTAQCPDRGGFESQAQALKDGANNALTAIWSTFQSAVEPKASVIPTLVNTIGEGWAGAGAELDTIQGHVHKHIQDDQWNSQGAQEYKAALPTQSKALHEFEELCYRATTVVTSAAAINGAVFSTIYQSLKNIEQPIRQKANSPVKNLEYWSGSGSSVDSSGCVSYEYYTRTSTAKVNLEAFSSWLSSFVTTRGEWATPAEQVAQDIPTTQNSVQNLLANGVWPAPKTVVTAKANVDDQTGTTGGRHGATQGQSSNDGVDLTNQGGIFG